MKDIPFFTTENGVASLGLREIGPQGCAYVTLRSTVSPDALLEECIGFCRAVGASWVFAKGHGILESYPFHTAILEMTCMRISLPETDAALFPVQDHTLGIFREIYNEKISRIPNGAWLTQAEAQRIAAAGEGYFIHRGDTLLGIGILSGSKISFLASVQPGAGQDVLCALAHGICQDTVTLEVASENAKAMGLYRELGFLPVRECSRWYRVFG